MLIRELVDNDKFRRQRVIEIFAPDHAVIGNRQLPSFRQEEWQPPCCADGSNQQL
jgi:hypothetical protein